MINSYPFNTDHVSLGDTLKWYNNIESIMAKKKEGSGLMSSAGLMRYYDAEETAISVHPKTVVIVAVAAGLAILALNANYHMWP